MRRIKLTLEYDGAHFFGWQVQARTGERTVQGTLEAALATVPGALPRVMAAGRTDAGVHALAMVAHYNTEDAIPVAKVPAALNARLPGDVRVLYAEEVGPDFEAQFGCRYRRYLYRMRSLRSGLGGSALERARVLFLPQRLDTGAMQLAAPLFEGTHDFAALATQEVRATVRTVLLCRLVVAGADMVLHVAADGFLRNMVRALVGTLLWVGEGKLEPSALPALLAAKDRRALGPNVPPHGLYFAEAGYAPWAGFDPEEGCGAQRS
jgi:tRNA pseudouridine38-40 synthase